MPDHTAVLAERYDTITYDVPANALAQPGRMAAIAQLHGVREARPLDQCSVLELGCGNGRNLLPIAARWPRARCVGCDIAETAIAAAREASDAMRLANVRWIQCDLRSLGDELGPFDFVTAHGMYSWVPPEVRDALFAVAAAHLARDGVLFVSYNAYPGCRIREIGWDVLRMHTAGITDPQARLKAARELCQLLAQPAATQTEHDGALRAEFQRMTERSDSLLFHDDLATINAPVYFTAFVAHAREHGLEWLAEAKPALSSATGVAPSVRQHLAGLDRIAAEQYLDFVRLRRYRQSLLVRSDARVAVRPQLDHVAALHVSAATPLVRAVAEGRALGSGPENPDPDERLVRRMLRHLVQRAPASLPGAEVIEWLIAAAARERLATRRAPAGMILDAAAADAVDLDAAPTPLTTTVAARPCASVLVRWQAARGDGLTNLRNETVFIKDAGARALLALCDGTRTLTELADALSADIGQHRSVDDVEASLAQLARHGMLVDQDLA